MKNKFFLLSCVFFIFAACAEADESPARPPLSVQPDVVISERFFINEMMEIFLNRRVYEGQIIQYEGLFVRETWADETFYAVVRHVPACCTPSESLGFEVLLNGNESFEDNAWVEVTGTLEINESGFIVLRAIYLLELEERGFEFVS
ncbi:MAG: hypothetical protein FWF79_06200 [Defluviitaleaceae bacterium]|nr:hypothetical protein [Defluviitaleaceae bacterium]